MTYGIRIPSAIGSEDVSDMTSFTLLAKETKYRNGSTGPFVYTAPSGWTETIGTFYVFPETEGVMPAFYASSQTEITAEFTGAVFDAAESWTIFWLIKSSTETPSGYGAFVKNGNGQTLISSETEPLLVISSGTLTDYYTSNSGYRSFRLPSDFNKSDSMVFLNLKDGANLFATQFDPATFGSGNAPGPLPGPYTVGSRTETEIDYFILKESFSLSASGGYGMEIYSETGQLVYSSNYSLFPSNGFTYRLKYFDSVPTSIDPTKNCWVNMHFQEGVPFDPGGTTGTLWLVTGIERSGSDINASGTDVYREGPTGLGPFYPNDNTSLIVQR